MVMSRDNLKWDLKSLVHLQRLARSSHPHLSNKQFTNLWNIAVAATLCLGDTAPQFGHILLHPTHPTLPFEPLIEKRRRLKSKVRHIETLGLTSGRKATLFDPFLELRPQNITTDKLDGVDHVEKIVRAFNEILNLLARVRQAKLRKRKWRKLVSVNIATGKFNFGRKLRPLAKISEVDEIPANSEKTEIIPEVGQLVVSTSEVKDSKLEGDGIIEIGTINVTDNKRQEPPPLDLQIENPEVTDTEANGNVSGMPIIKITGPRRLKKLDSSVKNRRVAFKIENETEREDEKNSTDENTQKAEIVGLSGQSTQTEKEMSGTAEMTENLFIGAVPPSICRAKSPSVALVSCTVLSNSILLKNGTAEAANKKLIARSMALNFFRSSA